MKTHYLFGVFEGQNMIDKFLLQNDKIWDQLAQRIFTNRLYDSKAMHIKMLLKQIFENIKMLIQSQQLSQVNQLLAAVWLATLTLSTCRNGSLFSPDFCGSRLKSSSVLVKLELPLCMRFYLKMFTDQETAIFCELVFASKKGILFLTIYLQK